MTIGKRTVTSWKYQQLALLMTGKLDKAYLAYRTQLETREKQSYGIRSLGKIIVLAYTFSGRRAKPCMCLYILHSFSYWQRYTVYFASPQLENNFQNLTRKCLWLFGLAHIYVYDMESRAKEAQFLCAQQSCITTRRQFSD